MASASRTATATAAEPRARRKRRRLLATATIAFVLSTIVLWYARLVPFEPIQVEDTTLTMAAHHKGKDAGLTRLATLPPAHLPTPVVDSPRLIIIGDVHGQLSALEALLRKTGFSRSRGDHVVFAGDLVNKGPDSGGVVDLAMSIRASAVRGNHEDRVLRAWEWEEERRRRRHGKGKGKSSSSDEGDSDEEEQEEEEEEEGEGEEEQANGKKKKKKKKKDKSRNHYKPTKEDRKTASLLTPSQRAWLASLPVILRVGPIPTPPYADDVLVVHGGLVPGLPLADQDLQAVMNVRSLVRRRRLRAGWHGATDTATFLSKEDTAAALSNHDDSEDNDDDDDDYFGDDGTTPPTTTSDSEAGYYHDDGATAQERLPGSGPEHALARAHALVPSGGHGGRPWAAAWDALQRRRRARSQRPATAVVYGHDARTGLAVREYALGLDSNCARGGELTAAVFEAVVAGSAAESESEPEPEPGQGQGQGTSRRGKEEEKEAAVVVRRRLVSVKCEEYDGKGGEGGGGDGDEKQKHKNKDKDKKKKKDQKRQE